MVFQVAFQWFLLGFPLVPEAPKVALRCFLFNSGSFGCFFFRKTRDGRGTSLKMCFVWPICWFLHLHLYANHFERWAFWESRCHQLPTIHVFCTLLKLRTRHSGLAACPGRCFGSVGVQRWNAQPYTISGKWPRCSNERSVSRGQESWGRWLWFFFLLLLPGCQGSCSHTASRVRGFVSRSLHGAAPSPACSAAWVRDGAWSHVQSSNKRPSQWPTKL